MSKRDDEALARWFPTRAAWRYADEVTDAMGPHEPMSAYLDAWVAAYRAEVERMGARR